MSNPHITLPRTVGNSIIEQRNKDGYINATAMCKAAGKEFSEYMRNKTTKEFIEALSADLGILQVGLVQSRKGGSDKSKQGTWVHPQIAIHLGQWLSPQFSVSVSRWVFDWLSGAPARQEWMEERNDRSKPTRRWFHSVLEPRVKEWNPGRGIAMCSDGMNREILGCTSKEFKKRNNLPKGALNRDYMTVNQVRQFSLAEQTAGDIIIAKDVYDKAGQKGECYKICKEVAKGIHDLIETMKVKLITQ